MSLSAFNQNYGVSTTSSNTLIVEPSNTTASFLNTTTTPVNIVAAAPALNQVLVADGAGNATWQNQAGGGGGGGPATQLATNTVAIVNVNGSTPNAGGGQSLVTTNGTNAIYAGVSRIRTLNNDYPSDVVIGTAVPSNGQALVASGPTAASWGIPANATLAATATLANTLQSGPNILTVTNAPANSLVLTATGPNAATWQPAAGGGGGAATALDMNGGNVDVSLGAIPTAVGQALVSTSTSAAAFGYPDAAKGLRNGTNIVSTDLATTPDNSGGQCLVTTNSTTAAYGGVSRIRTNANNYGTDVVISGVPPSNGLALVASSATAASWAIPPNATLAATATTANSINVTGPTDVVTTSGAAPVTPFGQALVATSASTAGFGYPAAANGVRTATGIVDTFAANGPTIFPSVLTATSGTTANWQTVTSAFGDDIAIGNGAVVDATELSVAIGKTALAQGLQSAAIGSFSVASGVNSVAIGGASNAIGSATAAGFEGTAIGTGSKASNGTAGGVAIGSTANASGLAAVAIGCRSTSGGGFAGPIASGDKSVAIGTEGTLSSALSAVAIGNNIISSGIGATSIGNGSQATNTGAVAIGGGCLATNISAIAVGRNVFSSVIRSAGFGNNCAASGQEALAMGCRATASAQGAICINTSQSAGGLTGFTNSVTNSISLGTNGVESFRMRDASEGNHLFCLGIVTVPGPSPFVPNVADYAKGYIRVTSGSNITFNNATNISGLNLDTAFASHLYVGLTFRCIIAKANGSLSITMQAPGAGVSYFGVASTGGNLDTMTLTFIRTGLNTWDMIAQSS